MAAVRTNPASWFPTRCRTPHSPAHPTRKAPPPHRVVHMVVPSDAPPGSTPAPYASGERAPRHSPQRHGTLGPLPPSPHPQDAWDPEHPCPRNPGAYSPKSNPTSPSRQTAGTKTTGTS
eukprot:jgi/Mesvir1/24650/Mv26001-RA.1